MSYQSTILEENFFYYLVTGSEMSMRVMGMVAERVCILFTASPKGNFSLIIDFSSLMVRAAQALQWTEGLR